MPRIDLRLGKLAGGMRGRGFGHCSTGRMTLLLLAAILGGSIFPRHGNAEETPRRVDRPPNLMWILIDDLGKE